MLARLSKRCQSMVINDGRGPTIFLTADSDPTEIPIHRIEKQLADGTIVKAFYEGIDNDAIVVIEFKSFMDFKVRPIGPIVSRN